MIIRDELVLINLHTIYPEIYKEDLFLLVPDKVAKLFHSFELEKEAERKRREYHKLYFFPVMDTDSFIESENNMRSTLEEILEREKKQWLYRAISTLTATQQKRVVAFYFLGQSQVEIAKKESVSQHAVSRSLTKAIQTLKSSMENNL